MVGWGLFLLFFTLVATAVAVTVSSGRRTGRRVPARRATADIWTSATTAGRTTPRSTRERLAKLTGTPGTDTGIRPSKDPAEEFGAALGRGSRGAVLHEERLDAPGDDRPGLFDLRVSPGPNGNHTPRSYRPTTVGQAVDHLPQLDGVFQAERVAADGCARCALDVGFQSQLVHAAGAGRIGADGVDDDRQGCSGPQPDEGADPRSVIGSVPQTRPAVRRSRRGRTSSSCRKALPAQLIAGSHVRSRRRPLPAALIPPGRDRHPLSPVSRAIAPGYTTRRCR
jgi:hypothetical protein